MDILVAVAARIGVGFGLGLSGGVGQVESAVILYRHGDAGQPCAGALPALRSEAGGHNGAVVLPVAEHELGGLAVHIVHRGGIGVTEGGGGVALAGADAVGVGGHAAAAGAVIVLGLLRGGRFFVRGVVDGAGIEGEPAIRADRGQELIGPGAVGEGLGGCEAVAAHGEGGGLDHCVSGGVGQQLLGGVGGLLLAAEVLVPGGVGGVSLVIGRLIRVICGFEGAVGVPLALGGLVGLNGFVIGQGGRCIAGITHGVVIPGIRLVLRILSGLLLVVQSLVCLRGQVVVGDVGRLGDLRLVGLVGCRRLAGWLEACVLIVVLIHVDGILSLRIAGAGVDRGVGHGAAGGGAAVGAGGSGVGHPGDVDGVSADLGPKVQIAGAVVLHGEVVLVGRRAAGHRVGQAHGLAGVLELGEHQHVGVHGVGRVLAADGVQQVVVLAHGQKLVVGAGGQVLRQAEGVAGGGVAGDLELLAGQVLRIEGQGVDLVEHHLGVFRPEDLLGGKGVGGQGDPNTGEALAVVDLSEIIAGDGLAAVEGVPGKFPAVVVEAILGRAAVLCVHALAVVDAELNGVQLKVEQQQHHPHAEAGAEVEAVKAEGLDLVVQGGDSVVQTDHIGLGPHEGQGRGGGVPELAALGGGIVLPSGEGHGNADAGFEVDLHLQHFHADAGAHLQKDGGGDGQAGEEGVVADSADGDHPVKVGILVQNGDTHLLVGGAVHLFVEHDQHRGGAVGGHVAQVVPGAAVLQLDLDLAGKIQIHGVGLADEGEGVTLGAGQDLFARGDLVVGGLPAGGQAGAQVGGYVGQLAVVVRAGVGVHGSGDRIDVQHAAGILDDLPLVDDAARQFQGGAHHEVGVDDGADGQTDGLLELEAKLEEQHGGGKAVGVLRGAVLEHDGHVEGHGELHALTLDELVTVDSGPLGLFGLLPFLSLD